MVTPAAIKREPSSAAVKVEAPPAPSPTSAPTGSRATLTNAQVAPPPSIGTAAAAPPSEQVDPSRKRKAESDLPSSAASSNPPKRTGLAQTALSGMDYPTPVRAPPPAQVPLPGADAFAKFGSLQTAARPMPTAKASASARPTQARMSTTDEFRSKVRTLICKAFTASLAPVAPGTPAAAAAGAATGGSAGSDDDFPVEVTELSFEIESRLFASCGRELSPIYRNKSREVAMNLKDSRNPALRADVLAGRVTVLDLLTKPFTQLASAALKSEREAAIKWEMQERRSDVSPHTTITDAFRCGKCRERRCSYYQMQTRSADEPMTTFVRCVACGNRWRC